MLTKGWAALALAALAASCAAAADDAKLPDVKAFDKAVIDSLRAVHNKGADLYNASNDHAAAYRLYQGALEVVRPLVAHRPEAQKIIDSGLIAAGKEADIDRKAFVLHETIESVRKQLKVANGFENAPAKKPEEKQPPEKKEPAPMPAAKGAAGSGGKVTVAGKPLATGEVTVVSVTLPAPRVFTAPVKDGAYRFAEPIPPARYRVLVTGEGVPARYHLVTTSGLVLEFGDAATNVDFDLK